MPKCLVPLWAESRLLKLSQFLWTFEASSHPLLSSGPNPHEGRETHIPKIIGYAGLQRFPSSSPYWTLEEFYSDFKDWLFRHHATKQSFAINLNPNVSDVAVAGAVPNSWGLIATRLNSGCNLNLPPSGPRASGQVYILFIHSTLSQGWAGCSKAASPY